MGTGLHAHAEGVSLGHVQVLSSEALGHGPVELEEKIGQHQHDLSVAGGHVTADAERDKLEGIEMCQMVDVGPMEENSGLNSSAVDRRITVNAEDIEDEERRRWEFVASKLTRVQRFSGNGQRRRRMESVINLP